MELNIPRLDREKICREMGLYMKAITDIKQLHVKTGARIEGEHIVVLLRRVWGELPTFLYEEPSNVERAVRYLLLSAFIAERWVLKLCRDIKKQMTVSIVGHGGSGKTTYAVYSGIGAALLLGMNYSEALELTRNLLFFDPVEFTEVVNRLSGRKEWVPFLILDDVGAQISKYWMTTGERYWAKLFKVLDLLKDICGVFIMTARSFEGIPARMREISDYEVYFMEVAVGGGGEVPVSIALWIPRMYAPKRISARSGYASLFAAANMYDAIPPALKMPQEIWSEMEDARRAIILQMTSELLSEVRPSGEEGDEG